MNSYVGHESQLYGVEEHRLVGGKGDGMRLFEINNGKGLQLTVSPDRACDITRLRFKGINMSYMSPCGYVAPAYYDSIGSNWLGSFTAGFLTTCGLQAVGSPCHDEGEELPLHGSIANIPCEQAYWDEEQGKLITCDPNLRNPLWRSEEEATEQILWSLHQADVVKISDDEVDFLWACTPEEGADKLLKEFDVSLAMVTLGPKGCLLKTNNAVCQVSSPKVSPVDTTGAGDIFGGSAVCRLLELNKPFADLTPEDLGFIGAFASTAASLSTEAPGGIPSIPEKDAVLTAM